MALNSTITSSTIDSSWCPGEPLSSEGLQHTVGFIEMELRTLNLRKDSLSERIAAIKQTITGLAKLFGAEAVNQQLPSAGFSEPPGRRRAHRGLTESCRQLLRSCPGRAFPLVEIVRHIRGSRPALLDHHKYPTQSLRVIMKRLVMYGEAVEVFVDVDRLAWKADSAKTAERTLRRHSQRQNPALSRACRIALLEDSALMSEKEIYSRIVRRGSFTFTNSHLAAVAVTYELNTLIEKGQARCIGMGNERRWQRVILADEVESSVG